MLNILLRNLQSNDTERKILVNFWFHTFFLLLLFLLIHISSLDACGVVDVSTHTTDYAPCV